MRAIAFINLSVILCSLALADEIALREDFEAVGEGVLPSGWLADGPNWSVRNGRLHGAAVSGETTIQFGPDDWRDVAVSADVWFTDAKENTRWAALLLRNGGRDAPGIQFTARRDATRSNGLELAARRPEQAGGGWRVFQTAAAPAHFSPNLPHCLRIEARGDWIRAFFDGKMVFECPRGNEASSAGRVGFRVNGAVAEFDNVEVARLEPMKPAELRRLRTRPLVVAHRGFSHRAPENTLVAYRLAIEAGADMAECDVRLSADRMPVLSHDHNLKRTTGLDAAVDSLSLAKLKELDAGAWKSAVYAGERIPTLTETLKLVHRQLRLVIEIKPVGMEREVIAAIHNAGVNPADVMIFSFRRGVIDAIAKAEPRLPTTWLIGEMPYEEDARRTKVAEALRVRASAIGLSLSRVDPAVVRLAHESCLPVFVWTVNDPADMHYLLRIGVDAIITDRPDVLMAILDESG